MTPNLLTISPSSGSAGGTLLTVTGTGFGTATAGLTLVDSSGTDVCASVSITGYGTFTCMTKAVEILTTNALSIKTSTATYACANTNAALCEY